jgi:monoterpene epsilon-lactone hydrolase
MFISNRKSAGMTIAAVMAWFIMAGIAAPALASDFYVPTTISKKGQAALRKFSRAAGDAALPAPNNLQGWKKAWAANERYFRTVSKRVENQYKLIIKERTLGGIPVLDIKPEGWQNNGKVLIYTHGGGYTMFSARSTLNSAGPVAHDTGMRIISVDYTLAPFAKFDQITDQVIAVIQGLQKEGYGLKDMAIYGDSAGGGLTAGSVLKMRDQGLGMPAAVVLWSPWADITETGDTYATLEAADPILYYPDNLKNCAAAYAPPAEQKNPYVSPVYADFNKGFPPTLIQGGTKEIFLSNMVRLYQALDQAGIPVRLDIYEGMWHVFQAYHWNLPESRLARKKMRDFFQLYLK